MKFKRGDKVWCFYHWTPVFNPPMCGKVICTLPFKVKHHFKKGEHHAYLLLMENWLLIPYPEACMMHLEEAINQHDKQWSKCPRDVSQLDSWMKLNQHQVDRVRYLHS
ncbi:hypothetical protein [Chondrinema litorale]|uniref:hypothetical protein n=1 Tax=Chondrinema litorale TaxID=2994555 RepID=UPI00254329E3|nr:hypothetical protein [Chondrinema litorale]UZS00247.1 hypothetical protein OQ292_40615 [Chondrinema litorale]